MLLKTIESYRLNIRAGVRGLWSGAFDYSMFLDHMMLSIERGFTQAWHEGISTYGILPDEMTEEEHTRLRNEVMTEFAYINGLGQSIISNSRMAGGKLEPLFARAELWVAGYNRIRILAGTYAAKDQKAEWVYGDTIHCTDCLRLNGKVHRMSIWRKYDVLPRSYRLKCRGYNCKCELVPTSKRATPGRPPSLSGL